MTDSDPPDEVRDRKAPSHRNLDTPNADAFAHQVSDRNPEDQEQDRSHSKYDPPEKRGLAVQNNIADLRANRLECLAGSDNRLVVIGIGLPRCMPLPLFDGHADALSLSWGFGFFSSAKYVVRGRVFSSASSA